MFDLRTFVGPNKPREKPYRLFHNDPRIQKIYNITKSYLIQKEIHLNLSINNNSNIQNIWNLNYCQINNTKFSQNNNIIDLSKHIINNTIMQNNINMGIINAPPQNALKDESNVTTQDHSTP